MSSAPDTAGARTGPVRRPAANELGRVLADFKRGTELARRKKRAARPNVERRLTFALWIVGTALRGAQITVRSGSKACRCGFRAPIMRNFE